MKLFFTSIFFLVSFCLQAQIDKIIPAKPVPAKLVTDYTQTLTTYQVQALENKLVAYDDSTSNQVAIVIVKSLEDYDIAEYALALGRKWGIGGAEFSNGVLLLIAMDDHKSRIEVGFGLEGAIPDVTARNILDNFITPNFKEGNYYRGLDLATDNIIKAAAGEYKAPANYGAKKKKPVGFASILGLIILFIILGVFGGGGRGSGGTMSGAGWILGSILSNAGRGGGWSGGSGGGGGGGFGGFGGGGFGGGGASGSW
ncbi:MAG TPA: TPM domain-containing protein [Chitinophagaceae bacterium]|nr:TPM domain-containing protein [Chitinophagaceae bacterium]